MTTRELYIRALIDCGYSLTEAAEEWKKQEAMTARLVDMLVEEAKEKQQ